MRHPLIAISLTAMIGLTACGDPSTPAVNASATTAPPAEPVATSVPSNAAGSGLPAAAHGEFAVEYEQPIAGTLTLDDNGCWFLDGAYGRGPIVFPPGFTLAESGTAVVGADGATISASEPVDIFGSLIYAAEVLPGGIDGKWGNHVAFCGVDSGVVVATHLAAVAIPSASEAAALVADLDLSSLVVDWPCGHGFATSTADQRIGVTITPVTADLPAGAFVTLPDERFDARIDVGANLFTNNCDDVLEWFEPERISVASFRIVGGTFTYPEPFDIGCAGGLPTTITVSDAVVALPTGDVSLGTIEITNDAPGCFAG